MYDSLSPFICDPHFQSSREHDDHTTTTLAAATIDGNLSASGNAVQHGGSNILAMTDCGGASVEADVQDGNPYHETLVDTISSVNDAAGPEEVPSYRSEPANSDRQDRDESGTVTPQVDLTESEAFALGTDQDPVHTPTPDECPVRAGAGCGEEAPGAVSKAYEAAQDTQTDAKDTANEPVQAAFDGKNLDPGVTRHNHSRHMRPSWHIHPLNNSALDGSTKRGHAPKLRPSHDVQPIPSQTVAVRVVIGTATDAQIGRTRATALTVSESSSLERKSGLRVSQKRVAAEQVSGTTKRTKTHDEGIYFVSRWSSIS